MFSIWVTVAITWARKARSVICRLRLAMRMKRSLVERPNPARSGWVILTPKLEYNSGLMALYGLLLVRRWPRYCAEMLVPRGKDSLKLACPWMVLTRKVGVPTRNWLASWVTV